MCQRPDFEGEEEELNQQLRVLYQMWKKGLSAWLTDEEMKNMDLDKQFLSDMEGALQNLRATNRLTPVGPDNL